MQQGKPPDASDNVLNFSMAARKRELESDFEPYFSHDERRQLRKLLALGPDAIERAIKGVEKVRTACPTFRREAGE